MSGSATDAATLGERLRLHRLGTGMRGEEVASAMEISASTLSRWENDLQSPTIVKLRLLARVLDITDYWNLLRGPEEGSDG